MSNYQQINGTWVIPKASVTPLRKQLAEEHNKIQEIARKVAEQALKDGCEPHEAIETIYPALKQSSNPHDTAVNPGFSVERITQSAKSMIHNAKRRETNPSRITKRDYHTSNNETVGFGIGHQAFIIVEGQNVSLHAEGNHIQEDIENLPSLKTLYQTLDNITWTKNTCGALRYTEYARDDTKNYGNNPVQLQAIYGPLGKKEDARQTRGLSPTKETRIKIPGFRRGENANRMLGLSPTKETLIIKQSQRRIPTNKKSCGKHMPRANTLCKATAGHKGACRRK